jgi:hypothetical protein
VYRRFIRRAGFQGRLYKGLGFMRGPKQRTGFQGWFLREISQSENHLNHWIFQENYTKGWIFGKIIHILGFKGKF